MLNYKAELNLDASKHNKALGDAANYTRKYKKEIYDANNQLRKMKNSGGIATSILQSICKQMGLGAKETLALNNALNSSLGLLGKLGVTLGAGAAGFKVLKDAFMSSETNIDNWGRTVSGVSDAYQTFVTTLNTGNWDGFFTNLSNAITEGQRLYNLFDRLNSMKVNNAPMIAILQTKIAELKVRQADGEDVGKQIKMLSDQLAQVQKLQVQQGKTANVESMVKELQRQDPNLTYKSALNIVKDIMQRGNTVFDEAEKTVKELEKKATKTVTTGGATTVHGTYQGTTKSVVDTGLLSKEERMQYRVAKAIADAESNMSPYIQGLTAALQEEAAVNNELKSNIKASNRGIKNGNGSVAKGTGIQALEIKEKLKLDTEDYTETTLEGLKNNISFIQGWLNDNPLMIDGKFTPLASDMLLQLRKLTEKKQRIELEISDRVSGKRDKWGVLNPIEAVGGLGNMPKLEGITETNNQFETMAELGEGIAKSFSAASSAIASFGSESVGAAAAMGALNIAGVIASVAGSYAKAMATNKSFTIWDWIAGAAAGAAALGTTIASVKSALKADKYATGGIVGGATSLNDSVLIRANKGEMVLNNRQQQNLFNMLNNGNGATESTTMNNVKFILQGEQLIGLINNTNKKKSRI